MKLKDYAIISTIFYLGWFGSVFLAGSEFVLVSLGFPLLLGGYFLFNKNLKFNDFVFVLGLSSVGVLFDFLMVYFGFVTAIGEMTLLIPVWLISIWFLFSLSMVKIGPNLNPPFWLAALLGGIMGPLSYKSGEYFQVLTFTGALTFLIYAIFWALAFPIAIKLSKRLV